MLTVRPKISELTFRLFGRSLHPELFQFYASRQLERKLYHLNVAIISSGHVMTLSCGDLVLAEVSAAAQQELPTQRQIFSEPIVANHQRDVSIGERIRYQTWVHLESADPTRLAGIQYQLLEASEYEGLVYQFQSSGRLAFGGISYVDIQARDRVIKIRSFHTFPDAYTVVKNETRLTILD
ncbi:MAG TPA: DUF2617 family protein [Pirellulaceae bacterium]|nr:DUF2617 family protein [Pirellulaceae bacterium]HMO91183.1 DUF2617 family protein [Pirellulaceae bacterium]HMP69047.1 DUF2617 family protein [Pirellulaceae bacterium]